MSQPLQRKALEDAGNLVAVQAKQNIAHRAGPGGAWPSGPWTDLFAGPRIWDDIAQKIVVEVKEAEESVAVGATHVAAAVRQLGTVGAGGTLPDIVPVKKKALTIPLTDAASRASYRGQTAREAFPDAFLLTRDGKHGASPLFVGVIARKVGGRTNKKTGEKTGQRLEALYLLVGKVAIRPHPFLPFDRDGNLEPERLGSEIDELILNNFVGKAV